MSGLPPQRLPDYYGRAAPAGRQDDLRHRLAGRAGVERNARALEKVLLEAGCTAAEVAAALGGNAARVFGLITD